jgi:hypothetical protein
MHSRRRSLSADRGGKTMKEMTSQEWHQAVREGLDEVSRRFESGELDGSGRFYTDAELAAGAATGSLRKFDSNSAPPSNVDKGAAAD